MRIDINMSVVNVVFAIVGYKFWIGFRNADRCLFIYVNAVGMWAFVSVLDWGCFD